MYIPTYLHTYIHTNIHTYLSTYILTYLPTNIPTYLSTFDCTLGMSKLQQSFLKKFPQHSDILSTNLFLKKWANPGLFFIYFCPFKHTTQFLKQINVKNVHPVHGARIRTHNLWNMSLLP